jgi:4-hydroxybenzoate polyprenyltransferase
MSDARTQPGLLRSYLELCRASNLPTVWTNALAATLLSGAVRPTLSSLAAGLSVTLVYLGGMALNDVLDVAEDKLKKPSRPIPSGRIPVAHAAAFAMALFGLGLLLLALFSPPPALQAGLALVAVVYLYDRLHQRSWLTVLLMAACRALVFVVCGFAAAGTLTRLAAVAAVVQFGYIVALTAVARWEKQAPRSFKVPPVPWMIACVSLVDGAMLALWVYPVWLLAGLLGVALTRAAQTQVRGD